MTQEVKGLNGNITTLSHACIHIFFMTCALSGYIFVNPFTSCVTDLLSAQTMHYNGNRNKICMY